MHGDKDNPGPSRQYMEYVAAKQDRDVWAASGKRLTDAVDENLKIPVNPKIIDALVDTYNIVTDTSRTNLYTELTPEEREKYSNIRVGPTDLLPFYGSYEMAIEMNQGGYKPWELAAIGGTAALDLGLAGLVARPITRIGARAYDIARGISKFDVLPARAPMSGGHTIPWSLDKFVPTIRPMSFALGIPKVDDYIIGSGRSPTGGAMKVQTGAFGRAFASRRSMIRSRMLDKLIPNTYPPPEEMVHYQNTYARHPDIPKPAWDAGAKADAITTRMGMDATVLSWADTGKAGPRVFAGWDKAGNPIYTTADYQPSFMAQAVAKKIGKGPLYHASPSTGLIVGSADQPLSTLGDVGAPMYFRPGQITPDAPWKPGRDG